MYLRVWHSKQVTRADDKVLSTIETEQAAQLRNTRQDKSPRKIKKKTRRRWPHFCLSLSATDALSVKPSARVLDEAPKGEEGAGEDGVACARTRGNTQQHRPRKKKSKHEAGRGEGDVISTQTNKTIVSRVEGWIDETWWFGKKQGHHL